MDYNLAEEKHFDDMCSLHLSRGGIHRLLGDSKSASKDFDTAYKLIDELDLTGRVRVLSFQAFCLIDQNLYEEALKVLEEANALNQAIMDDTVHTIREEGDEKVVEVMAEANISNIKLVEDEIQREFMRIKTNRTKEFKPLTGKESELLYLRRIDWILKYHSALSMYMQKKFDEAAKALEYCLSPEYRKFVADDISLGAIHFYLAQSYMRLESYDAVEINLNACLKTHWVDNTKNKFLCLFAMAKLYQVLTRHAEAIDLFNRSLEMYPEDAHVYFRRAWSQKVRSSRGFYTVSGRHCIYRLYFVRVA